MARLTILGSAYSIPDKDHDNTHLVVESGIHTVLIDCAGNPVARLRRAGLDPLQVTDLVLTHFHPDHTYGVPLLLMDLWLMGRRHPLTIHGLQDCLTRMESVMDLYDWRRWPNFFQVTFQPVSAMEGVCLLESMSLKITASPVCHLIPTIGLRFDSPLTGRALAYSCDTEPCAQVVRLAAGVSTLIHEAAGPSTGHTSPAQAGAIARQAGAASLVLIHFPTRSAEPERWIREAREEFTGPVALAEDYATIEF